MATNLVTQFRKHYKPSPNREYRELLLWLYDGKCAYCGTRLAKGFHCDHIKAYRYGGKTIITNMCASCPDCNMSKGTSDWSHKYTKPNEVKLVQAHIKYIKLFKLEHLL